MKSRFLFLVAFLTIIATSMLVIRANLLKRDAISLINISNMSGKFMTDYFDDYKKITEEDKENILIVISSRKLHDDFGAKDIIEGPNHKYYLLYDDVVSRKNAITKLKEKKYIVSVEENLKSKFYGDDNSSNTSYNSWGIEAIGLDHGKEIVSSITPNPVKVAIIDTGCNMELFNRHFQGKIEETYNIFEDSNEMYDNFGHGTHIAGTIAEGTSDNVKIIPFKVSDGEELYETDIITAIDYITYNRTADVINMSFGGYNMDNQTYESEYQSIEAARQENIISVAAAGNESTDQNSYPAAFDNTISISAVDSDFKHAEFSNFGETISFAAPGVDIKSLLNSNTVMGQESEDEEEDFGLASGTSMAAPHAVSVVAILKSFNKTLTFENTMELLKEYSVDIGQTGFDEYFGYGLINLKDTMPCKDEDNYCDDYRVFKKLVPSSMSVEEATLTNYNYGSLTNILGTKVLFEEKDGYNYEKQLWELENAEITGYDPYETGNQTVNVTYKDMHTSFTVQNPDIYESGWEYQEVDNKTYLSKYKDNDLKIGRIIFPEKIDNKAIDGIRDANDEQFRIFYDSTDAKYIKEIILPKNITYLGVASFKEMENVQNITSLANEITVGAEAFEDMPSLTIVEGKIILKEDSRNAFAHDSSLKSITISENTSDTIPYGAFNECSALTSINIPENIKKIRDFSLSSTKLTEISLPEGLIYLGVGALKGTKIEHLYIPKNVETIGMRLLESTPIKTIAVDEENTHYDSRNNSNVIIETQTNKVIQGAELSTIPDTVKTIGKYAFTDLKTKEIILPEGVTTLEDYAFTNCLYLEKVEVPNSLNQIDKYSLFGNGYAILPFETPIWVHEDSYAHNFAKDNNLVYVVKEDSSNVVDIDRLSFTTSKTTYHPGELADFITEFNYYYFDKNNEYITAPIDDYKIKYQRGDSIQMGDNMYYAYGNLPHSYQNIETSMIITVIPRNTDVELPTVEAVKGDSMCEYEFEEGTVAFEYCITLDKLGEHSIVGDLTLKDTGEVIENVDVNFNVKDKIIINECAIIEDKEYDGTTNITTDSLKNLCSDVPKEVYSVLKLELLSPEPNLFAPVNIKVRINDEYYDRYAFYGNRQEAEWKGRMFVYKGMEKPSLKKDTYVYNGTKQIIEFNNFNSEGIFIVDEENLDLINVGDVYFHVNLKDGPYKWNGGPFSQEDFEYVIHILPAEPNIDYTSEDVTVPYDGEYHGISLKVNSPEEYTIYYMDENNEYTLTEMPLYKDPGTHKIKYKIHSDNNHKDVIGENSVTITQEEIKNYTTDYIGIYDGEYHSINVNVNLDNYNILYSVDNTSYNLTEIPKFKDVGEYTVNYKITSNDYEDIIGSNVVKIYGIKEIDSSLKVKPYNAFNYTLITNDHSFNTLSNKITSYSLISQYDHFDANNKEINDDLLKTGDLLIINVNEQANYRYKIAVRGDVNGDGLIDSADLLAIRRHLLNINVLNNEYALASDINFDDKIDSADLLAVRKHLLGKELIGED